MNIYIYICTHFFIYTYLSIYLSIFLSIHLYIYIILYMYSFIYISVYKFICIYILQVQSPSSTSVWFWLTRLESPGSFSPKSWRIGTANPAWPLKHSLPTDCGRAQVTQLLTDPGSFLHRDVAQPHGVVQTLHRMSTCITQLTLGLFRRLKWLQLPVDFRENQTPVAHRVDWIGLVSKTPPVESRETLALRH